MSKRKQEKQKSPNQTKRKKNDVTENTQQEIIVATVAEFDNVVQNAPEKSTVENTNVDKTKEEVSNKDLKSGLPAENSPTENTKNEETIKTDYQAVKESSTFKRIIHNLKTKEESEIDDLAKIYFILTKYPKFTSAFCNYVHVEVITNRTYYKFFFQLFVYQRNNTDWFDIKAKDIHCGWRFYMATLAADPDSFSSNIDLTVSTFVKNYFSNKGGLPEIKDFDMFLIRKIRQIYVDILISSNVKLFAFLMGLQGFPKIEEEDIVISVKTIVPLIEVMNPETNRVSFAYMKPAPVANGNVSVSQKSKPITQSTAVPIIPITPIVIIDETQKQATSVQRGVTVTKNQRT